VHDTVTVYAFLEKLLNEYLKPELPHIEKVNYFSDGSGAQYKNYKNFTNLIHHDADFNLKAEWNFFATSHGKNACDGVGGTIKRLAARASLQRAITNQIQTPEQLFQFAVEEIPGVTVFFVSSESVEKTSKFLEPRFSTAPRFKGSRKNHQFIPRGSDIVMRRVSGGKLGRWFKRMVKIIMISAKFFQDHITHVATIQNGIFAWSITFLLNILM